MKELLKKLTALDGTSGYEDDVRQFIKDEINGHADEIFEDALGNLYAFKKGAYKVRLRN